MYGKAKTRMEIWVEEGEQAIVNQFLDEFSHLQLLEDAAYLQNPRIRCWAVLDSQK